MLKKVSTFLLVFLLLVVSYSVLYGLSAIYRNTPIAAVKIATPYTDSLQKTTILGNSFTCPDDNNCYMMLAGERFEITLNNKVNSCSVHYGAQQATCRVSHLNVTGVRHIHIGDGLDIPSQPLQEVATSSRIADWDEATWISFGTLLVIGATAVVVAWSWQHVTQLTPFTSTQKRWGYSLSMSALALVILLISSNVTLGLFSGFGLFLPSSIFISLIGILTCGVFLWWYTLDGPALQLWRRVTFTLGNGLLTLCFLGFGITFQLIVLNIVD